MVSAPVTVSQLLERARLPLLSFEFFPPRSEEEEDRLWQTVDTLSALRPDFVSITYGASGSNRDRTLAATRKMADRGGPTTVGHLTCASQSKDEIARALDGYAEAGIRNILAIRGDMPGGPREPWIQHPKGLANATELVEFVHSRGEFCVGVAAFPNPHQPDDDPDLDARIVAAKADAGADYAITQLFFEAERYIELVQRVRALGCEIPLIPGVMPLTTIGQIERFADLSGCSLPDDFVADLRAVADDKAAVRRIGLARAERLCSELIAAGAPGLQFFTQNRARAVRELFDRPWAGALRSKQDQLSVAD